jgi:hypothetical protein
MTPICIAFELQTDKIEIISIGIPETTVSKAVRHFQNNFSAQSPSIHDLTPPPPKINIDDVIVKDISHIELKNLIGVDTLSKLENLYQTSEKKNTPKFTNTPLSPKMHSVLQTLQEKGTMTLKEILQIIVPELVDKL